MIDEEITSTIHWSHDEPRDLTPRYGVLLLRIRRGSGSRRADRMAPSREDEVAEMMAALPETLTNHIHQLKGH